VPHFALLTVDGDTLGAHELDSADWPSGSVIYRDGDEPNLRVVDRLEPPDQGPERFDVLIVEPA